MACLRDVATMMLDCEARGACILQQSVTPPPTATQCFGNGIKIRSMIEQRTEPTELTSTYVFVVKKADTVCYTRTLVSHTPVPAAVDGGITQDIVTQDPSGATVATVHVGADNVVTATCPGGAPTVLMKSCGISELLAATAYLTDSPTASCPDGSCDF